MPAPEGAQPLHLVPVTYREVVRFIAAQHRHNDPPRGWKVAVGVADSSGTLRGVGVVGRPVARGLDDGLTAEITRIATDGLPNACSMLYGALTRAAWALGYRTVYTYTLASEPGASVRAAGFVVDAQLPDRDDQWNRYDPAAPRAADRLTLFYEPKLGSGAKVRWVRRRTGQ